MAWCMNLFNEVEYWLALTYKGKCRLTRFSSLLPNVGLDLDSVFCSIFFGGGVSFFGAGLGSSFLGSGVGLDSSDGFDSFFGAGSEDVGCSFDAASFGSESAFSSFPPDGASPSSRRTRSCPTVTVSSSFARNSFIVPDAGALTATSIYVAK